MPETATAPVRSIQLDGARTESGKVKLPPAQLKCSGSVEIQSKGLSKRKGRLTRNACDRCRSAKVKVALTGLNLHTRVSC